MKDKDTFTLRYYTFSERKYYSYYEKAHDLMIFIYKNLPKGGKLYIPKPKSMGEIEGIYNYVANHAQYHTSSNCDNRIGVIHHNTYMIEVYLIDDN